SGIGHGRAGGLRGCTLVPLEYPWQVAAMTARNPPSFLTLVAGPALSVLTLNMFLPSLPRLAADLGATYGQATLAFSGYLAAVAVLQLILGPLSDRYGRRPVLLVSLVGFIAASVGCALAQSLPTFLAFRAAQGLVIAGSTLSLAAVRDTTDPAEAASRIGFLGMVMAIGPMIGPMIGGVLDTVLGWRAIFWGLGGLGVCVTVLSWVDFGETNTRKSSDFGAQFRAYPALLTSGLFWSCAMVLVCGIGCFYIFISGAPLVADQVFALDSAQIGIAIGIITTGFFVGNYVSGRITKRVGLGPMIVAGRVSAVAGMVVSVALLGIGVENVWLYFGCVTLVGFGNGLSTPSANSGVMSVDPALAGSAAGLSGAMIMGGGAVLTAGAAAVLGGPAIALQLALMILVVAVAGLIAGVLAQRGLARLA
ncbi:MAG: multidrug effflux MFS transporter, partial [Pseudomonadota bacterium]